MNEHKTQLFTMTVSTTYGIRVGTVPLFLTIAVLLLCTGTANARITEPCRTDRVAESRNGPVHPEAPTINELTEINTKNIEGDPLAPTVGRNDISPTVPQDALPANQPDRYETAIAITQDIMLAGPPYTAYSPLGGFPGNPSSLPRYAVKSNLLYAAGTLTPNLAVELALSGKASLVISGSYNPWNRKGSEENNEKLVHFVIRPEFRYWLCETYNGHFFGANPFFTQFNVSDRKIPFVDFRKGYRYEGYAVGAGVNYGYQFPLGKRWGLEVAVGVGAAYMNYDVYDCILCGDRLDNRSKWYFGPTHAAVNLVFLIK